MTRPALDLTLELCGFVADERSWIKGSHRATLASCEERGTPLTEAQSDQLLIVLAIEVLARARDKDDISLVPLVLTLFAKSGAAS